MKAISYSLFGYGKPQPEGCFPFFGHMRGLAINLRLARLLYPEWKVMLEIDEDSYYGFKDYFDAIPVILEINKPEKLTKAMLWRLKPIFHKTKTDEWEYTHIICRDLDAPLTYRERQAVEYWINRDKALHCITDSISHNLPMMGGMIGMRPAYFTERIGHSTWESMMSINGYDWNRKGTDQHFLNDCIYPPFAKYGNDSITEHYVKGMPQSFLSDCHKEIQSLEIENVPFEMKESNNICGHIGAAGWYQPATTKFLNIHKDKFEDLIEIERRHKDVFYWTENLIF